MAGDTSSGASVSMINSITSNLDVIITAMGGGVTAFLTAVFSYRAAMRQAAALEVQSHTDAQSKLNDTMTLLVDEMKADRELLKHEISRLKDEGHDLRNMVMSLQFEVNHLQNELAKHGITPSPPPAVPHLVMKSGGGRS